MVIYFTKVEVAYGRVSDYFLMKEDLVRGSWTNEGCLIPVAV